MQVCFEEWDEGRVAALRVHGSVHRVFGGIPGLKIKRRSVVNFRQQLKKIALSVFGFKIPFINDFLQMFGYNSAFYSKILGQLQNPGSNYRTLGVIFLLHYIPLVCISLAQLPCSEKCLCIFRTDIYRKLKCFLI